MVQSVIERDEATRAADDVTLRAPDAVGATACPGPGVLRSTRTLAWSLVLNGILVGAIGLWVARRVVRSATARSDVLQQMRAGHLHELARRSAPSDVVMLGDSLTQYAEWSELMGCPVANRGVAGDTIEQVRQRLSDVVALHPKVLFLLVGVNDLEDGVAPPEVARRHAALIRELRATLPTTRLVVQAILPVRGQRRLSLSAISDTNALLRHAAKAAGAAWLDVGSVLVDPTGQLDPRYSLDGLHLTGDGYRAWAEAIRPLLP